jgi:hypothetical protein
MSSQLRDLAKCLRKEASELEKKQTKKCASLAVAAIGLNILECKIRETV